MTLLNYADPVPTPALITSGSGTQSYTDPTGEVWVAANGVYGGAWKKARDVLYARWHRAAAYSVSATLVGVPFDTMDFDAYGLYSQSSVLFTAPIPGIYELRSQVLAVSTQANQVMANRVVAAGVVVGFGSACIPVTGQNMVPFVTALASLTVGQNIYAQANSTVAAVLNVSSPYNWIELAYRGTG